MNLVTIGLGLMIAGSGLAALLSIVTLCGTALHSRDMSTRLSRLENEWHDVSVSSFPNTANLEYKSEKVNIESTDKNELVIESESESESENLLM